LALCNDNVNCFVKHFRKGPNGVFRAF
jgi:hypothetical protein